MLDVLCESSIYNYSNARDYNITFVRVAGTATGSACLLFLAVGSKRERGMA